MTACSGPQSVPNPGGTIQDGLHPCDTHVIYMLESDSIRATIVPFDASGW
jgi:hypothetical protein